MQNDDFGLTTTEHLELEAAKAQQPHKMTRFPLRELHFAPPIHEFYFTRRSPRDAWRVTRFLAPTRDLNFLGSSADYPFDTYCSQYIEAEACGPIPFPSPDLPLSDGPDLF